MWAIVAAGFSALSAFAVTRVLHGVVATELWARFYSQDERELVLLRWREDWSRQPNSWKDHVLPGFGYLVFFVALALLANWIDNS